MKLAKGTELVKFFLLTPEQAEKLQVDPELIALAKNQFDDIVELNCFVQDLTTQGNNHPQRPQPEYNKLSFPTPKTC